MSEKPWARTNSNRGKIYNIIDYKHMHRKLKDQKQYTRTASTSTTDPYNSFTRASKRTT